MNMIRKTGGFTLVELIVVIAILAILAGVAVPAYSGYINSANEAADITALGAVKTAAQAAMATVGEVTKIEVTENDDGNTVEINDKYILKYSSNKWIAGSATTVTGESDIAADFDAFINSADIELVTGSSATWSGSEWVIS